MEIKASNFIVDPKAINNNSLYLSETESHHLSRVFRAKQGDIFHAIDGSGKKYRAVINSISSKKVTADIISTVRLENEPLVKLSLAVGLSRPAKIDYIVEKGTEIGVYRFYFFTSEKTLVEDKLDSPAMRKISRWKKLAVSAAKQSLRTVVPEILPPVHLDEILALADDYELALLADMKATPSSIADLMADSPREILLMIGPESGLSENEIKRALNAGFRAVKLGPRRLRVETAAVVSATLLMSAAGEL